MTEPRKIAIVGSGNWGTAIAKIVAKNCKAKPNLHETVTMWVYEEEINGRKLTEIINQDHENVKYLPGYKLPENLVAEPDIVKACTGSNILVFVIPHQFIPGLCEQIKGVHAPDCIAISLIKGLDFDKNGIVLISDAISKALGGMDVSVLMGANLAGEVAAGCFCETTIGYHVESNGKLLKDVFDYKFFSVGLVGNVAGVEICGALKNIVALGAGYSDGMKCGENCKAAVIRIGLMEMRKFIETRFPDVKDDTFFHSCGIADLITTSYGGRNHKVAKAFVEAGGKKSMAQLEAEMLNGQKLQGTLTCQEIHQILVREKQEAEYPFFSAIYKIAFEGFTPELLISMLGGFDLNDGDFSLPQEGGAPESIKRLEWHYQKTEEPKIPLARVYSH